MQFRCRIWTTVTIRNYLFDVLYHNILHILRFFHIHNNTTLFSLTEIGHTIIGYVFFAFFRSKLSTRRLMPPSALILLTRRRNTKSLPPRNAGLKLSSPMHSATLRLLPARKPSLPSSRQKLKLNRIVCFHPQSFKQPEFFLFYFNIQYIIPYI